MHASCYFFIQTFMKCQLIHQLRDKIGLKLTWRVTFLLFFSKTIDSLQCVTKHIWGSHALKRRRGVKFLPLSHEKKWCNEDFLRTEACKCQTGNFRQILMYLGLKADCCFIDIWKYIRPKVVIDWFPIYAMKVEIK